jgi:hypothetical protein
MCLVASVADAKPSNPAFLGIGMHDVQGQQGGGPALGPCIVDNVTRGSGAKAAGLQSGDMLLTIAGTPVPNCDAVLKVVQSHEPGDTVKITVDRIGRPRVLTASLVSRDEILRRRIVGQSMGATEVVGADDQRGYDLGSLRGKTAIVGWFDVACTECRSVFTKLADWSRAQAGKPGVQLMPLAVVSGDPDSLSNRGMGLDVPLAIADPSLYEEFTIPDRERINFMVVDCRGVVQYVAPIAPNSDDTDAVLDELFAAAEQASRRASKSSVR